MLTHGLRTLFLAQSAITTLAPAQTVGRVSFPAVFVENVPEQVKPPYVVVELTDTDPLMTLDSTYHGSGQEDTVDVHSVSYSLPDARLLDKTIRLFFQDYAGNVTADGITDEVKAVMWQGQAYDFDYEQDGTDKKKHIFTTTYSVLQKQGA